MLKLRELRNAPYLPCNDLDFCFRFGTRHAEYPT